MISADPADSEELLDMLSPRETHDPEKAFLSLSRSPGIEAGRSRALRPHVVVGLALEEVLKFVWTAKAAAEEASYSPSRRSVPWPVPCMLYCGSLGQWKVTGPDLQVRSCGRGSTTVI